MDNRNNRRKVADEVADLPLSRQRKYQLRKVRDGQCMLCGQEAYMGTVLCYDHHIKRGVRRPGRNKSHAITLPDAQESGRPHPMGRHPFVNG